MKRALLAVALVSVAGCGDDDCCQVQQDAGPMDAPVVNPNYTEVALIPATVNRDVDMLFVIDDSPSMTDKQQNLKNNFPNLINVLTTVQGGLPNIHLGVVTSDMGTTGSDGTAGNNIGSGPGSCQMTGGKDGALQVYAAPVQGNFLSDLESGGGRVKNYTGTLNDAFSAMATAGAAGCGFEQTLAAMQRSFENTINAGFIRPAARLAIIVLTDEDDCSLAHPTILGSDTATLGPLQSFRCTRFGVTCDVGGMTSDAMNSIGGKDQCHSNEQSDYLTDVGRYASFLSTLKADPRDVMFGAIAGAPTPFTVELRTPPGGGTAIAALAHSCSYQGMNGPEVADPPTRIVDLASKLRQGSVDSVCNGDLSGVMFSMGQRIKTLIGDPCLERAIALPAMCEVFDQSAAGNRFVPACDATHTTDCFSIVSDAAVCPAGQQLKLDVTRTTTPSADTWTSVRCAL